MLSELKKGLGQSAIMLDLNQLFSKGNIPDNVSKNFVMQFLKRSFTHQSKDINDEEEKL
jgi:hypothetical protein